MEQQRQLRMIRPNLDNLPPVIVPNGCQIRTYLPGDEAAWAEIMNTGIGTGWSVEMVKDQLISQPQFDAKGLFFAICNGHPIGSACAWRGSLEEQVMGNVHMVCVLPEARGNNLGYLLTLAVLHRLKQQGFRQADLLTDDFRIPAIRSYLRLGFEPFCYDETDVERWGKVMEAVAVGNALRSVPPGSPTERLDQG